MSGSTPHRRARSTPGARRWGPAWRDADDRAGAKIDAQPRPATPWIGQPSDPGTTSIDRDDNGRTPPIGATRPRAEGTGRRRRGPRGAQEQIKRPPPERSGDGCRPGQPRASMSRDSTTREEDLDARSSPDRGAHQSEGRRASAPAATQNAPGSDGRGTEQPRGRESRPERNGTEIGHERTTKGRRA